MSKFVIREVESGIRFDLVASNGRVIATSVIYANKDRCLKGIERTKLSAPDANLEDQTQTGIEIGVNSSFEIVELPKSETDAQPRFEMYVDKTGAFRFRLRTSSGKLLIISDRYSSKASCTNGVETVRINVIEADKIDDRVPLSV